VMRSPSSGGFVTLTVVLLLVLASLLTIHLAGLRAKLQTVETIMERIERRLDA